MGNRSTRNKLRWQAEKVLSHVDKAFEHFQFLDELANKQSAYINDTLPMLLFALQEYRKAVERFREGL